jgi:hypothetical protein
MTFSSGTRPGKRRLPEPSSRNGTTARANVHPSTARPCEVVRYDGTSACGRAADQVVQLVLGIDQVLRGKAQLLVAGRSTGVSSMNMKAAAARATLAPVRGHA